MILHRTLTREEVLETILMLAAQNVPDGLDGDIGADYDEEGGIEVYFISSLDENAN